MTDSQPQGPKGPDLTQGIAADSLTDGQVVTGHVGDDAVLLVRRGNDHFAIGASCTHYGGPLAEGLTVGDTVRCPWHHACFSLRTGEALRAPALNALDCWSTDIREGRVFVGARKSVTPIQIAQEPRAPRNIVIIGGGAAGFAAAEMLRRRGYDGRIVMLSDDDAAPVDRPNLSKDYLAGNAPEEWIPLRDDSFYAEQKIDLRLRTAVVAIDPAARRVTLRDGSTLDFERLLLATGAEPIRLSLSGIELPHVHTLRSLADCRAIIAQAGSAKRAVVLGAGFIGLEVAASLRARGIDVHVVAPDSRPMARVLGDAMGDFVRTLHESHGVTFHLEQTPAAIDAHQVTLKSGVTIPADLVIAGVGVRPRLALAEQAGLTIDRGVVVNQYLETSAPGIFAAGDIARWPDKRSGSIRVEHWVVAERQGQTAAVNMLGGNEPFDDVPFFWSQHYDVPINYVGHAESWDDIVIEGNIASRDCVVRYKQKGRVMAVASIYRDRDSLVEEVAMKQAPA